jgi:hypothetical protein
MKLLRTLGLGKENGTPKGKALSRRGLLKALGVSAAASPFIPALDSWAADYSATRRLLLVFTPDGMVPEQWWPTGTEDSWQLADIMKPLERHKNDLIVMKGLPHRTQGSGAHEQAMGGLFTGNSLIGKTGGAASVDQIIVQQLKSQLNTDFPSLQFGVHSFYGGEGDLTSKLTNNNSYTIYAGPSQRIPAESDPYKMYDRVFGNSGGGGMAAPTAMGDAGMEKLRAERKSILDFVKAELSDVSGLVSKTDRMKIESHVESVREVERRLSSAGPKMVGAVARPQGGIALDRNANFPMIIPIMNQLLVSTLAADRTRISYMQYSRGFSLVKHDWLGAKEQHHFLSHKTSEKPILAAIQKWYMEHIAKLFDLMKAVPEGGSTLFDNTVIVYANELHTGWDHAPGPTATFWASRGAGAIAKTGRFIDYAGSHDHNQMLCTIAHAMGARAVTKVGNMGKEGILPNILA